MVCGVGLLHAEASSGSTTLRFAQFHQNSLIVNLGDYCSNTIDMAYNNHRSSATQGQVTQRGTKMQIFEVSKILLDKATASLV